MKPKILLGLLVLSSLGARTLTLKSRNLQLIDIRDNPATCGCAPCGHGAVTHPTTVGESKPLPLVNRRHGARSCCSFTESFFFCFMLTA